MSKQTKGKSSATTLALKEVDNHLNRIPGVKFLYGFLRKNMSAIIALVGLSTLLAFTTNSFFTVDNLINVIRQVSISSILAIGITFTLITVGVDLSIGSTVAMSGVLAVMLIETMGAPLPVAILAAVLLGTVAGFLNGYLISRTGMPPFIVTLATQLSLRGIAYVFTAGQSVTSKNSTFNFIGNGYVLGIPVPIIFMIVIAIIASLILNKTKFGRHMYATGGNKEAAIYSGIKVKRVQVGVYMICGTLAAIAGVLWAARMYSGQPNMGVGFEGDAVAASVLGGTSFSGGVGTIGGVMIGSLVMGVLSNGFTLLKIPLYYQYIVKGLVILLAVYIDTMKKNKQNSV